MDYKSLLDKALEGFRDFMKENEAQAVTFSHFFFNYVFPLNKEANYLKTLDAANEHSNIKLYERGLVTHIEIKEK